MSQQEGASTRSSFFDLTVDGVGYLNRVRSVKPKKVRSVRSVTGPGVELSSMWRVARAGLQ